MERRRQNRLAQQACRPAEDTIQRVLHVAPPEEFLHNRSQNGRADCQGDKAGQAPLIGPEDSVRDQREVQSSQQPPSDAVREEYYDNQKDCPSTF